MRVGTTLYKVVNQPCASGGYEKRRVIWNNSTLRQDYGKNYLATVPKYDGFCTVPDHLNYRKEIDGFLNLYEPIEHTPQIGDFPNIRSLVLHIFGEQYNLGLDYLQLLFLQLSGASSIPTGPESCSLSWTRCCSTAGKTASG